MSYSLHYFWYLTVLISALLSEHIGEEINFKKIVPFQVEEAEGLKDKILFQMWPICCQDAKMQVIEFERHVQYK